MTTTTDAGTAAPHPGAAESRAATGPPPDSVPPMTDAELIAYLVATGREVEARSFALQIEQSQALIYLVGKVQELDAAVAKLTPFLDQFAKGGAAGVLGLLRNRS